MFGSIRLSAQFEFTWINSGNSTETYNDHTKIKHTESKERRKRLVCFGREFTSFSSCIIKGAQLMKLPILWPLKGIISAQSLAS